MRYTLMINNARVHVASIDSARRIIDTRGGVGVICDRWGVIVARHKAR
jgi:hypothetical protein